MKLPRDVTGKHLAQKLSKLGYVPTRQSGSHLILQPPRAGMMPINVPQHKAIRVGMLHTILKQVAVENGVSVESLCKTLGL
jgi:predicted RNA binding protein YcfA (HicA-like mRNA interferase family)